MIRLPAHARRPILLAAAAVLAMAQGPFAATAAHAAAPAAAKVYLVPSQGAEVFWFEDTAGVTDDVTVSIEAGGTTVTDPVRPLAAGAGCVNAGAHTVTCAHAGPVEQIHLGGGDDRYTARNLSGHSVSSRVYGEAGNDVLTDLVPDGRAYGGPGDDVLDLRGGRASGFGGPGDDRLDGRRGYEVWLWGDDGDDVLWSGPAGDLYGGNGDDRLDGGDPNRPKGALVCDGGPGTNVLVNCPA